MNNNSFAVSKGLKPADVVVVPKSGFNIVEHYVVYWGMDVTGTHFYLENNQGVGVRWLNEAFFVSHNPKFTRINIFQGNDYQRNIAINRAVALVGQKYDLAKFNCENYANYTQTGVSTSKQVENISGAIIISGLLVLSGLAFSK